MKLTDWFERGTKPARPGVYQTLNERTYQHWDGEKWGYCANNPEACSTASELAAGSFQDPPWRGLAEDTSGSKA